MNSFISSDLFLLMLTTGLFCLGGIIYRRTRLALLHPVLLTFVAMIVFLQTTGIPYSRYQEATRILDFALGMSVVALGYLLYEQVERLRGSLVPVGVATLVGCVTGVLSVVYTAKAFGAERMILNSIAPKSVTVPIAVSVSGPLGGNVSVTSVVVFCVESSAVFSANGFCAAAACATPKPGDSPSERRHTASARPGPSK